MMLFGWRIAFLLGALTGVVGVLLRRRMPDPTVFLQRKHAIEEQLGVADDCVPEDRSVGLMPVYTCVFAAGQALHCLTHKTPACIRHRS